MRRGKPTPTSGDAIDLGRSEGPRSIVRSLDFARDDKIFSKNKFCQFSDIYIQEVFVPRSATTAIRLRQGYGGQATLGFVFSLKIIHLPFAAAPIETGATG
jgi:hypothetical protein